MFNIPDAQVVLEELAPVLEHLQGALEGGMLGARAFFDSLHLYPDADLAPSIVRFYAKQTLDTTRKNLTEEKGPAYSLRNILGNRLMLKAGVQTASPHWLRLCGMKPTVLDPRNLLTSPIRDLSKHSCVLPADTP